MVSYTFRRSVLTQYETWEVTPSGLVNETARVVCPYEKIKSIRLKYAPGRVKTNNYICEIEYHGTGIKTSISSTSYISFGNFENLGKAYQLFVTALIEAAAIANPTCEFYSGKKPLHFILEYLAVALMLIGLFWLMFALDADLTAFIAVKLLIILYSVFYLITAYTINKPGKFNPNAIPSKLFPAIKS